ncbi:MAG TPA: YhfC family glutamic-type intramembrane protease [Anaerolineales bacterium]|nr:YhfC family glutamic-type intramembrane protease [Anaerolineales bacterium]
MDILIRFFNAAWMVGMPLVLGVLLARTLRTGWRPFLIGAATFLGAQVLHIPINAWVLSPGFERLGLVQPLEGPKLVLAAGALGLSAGLFEEGARYLVLRRWLRDVRTWRQAVMFGAGHGGLEAAVLGVLALVALFQGLAYRDADLSGLVTPDRLGAAQAQLRAYWAAPASLVALGSAERAIALCIQISLAVIVLQAFTRGNPAWLGVAIVWHAFVDALAVAAVGIWGPYWTEAALAVLALVSLGVLFSLRQPDVPADQVQAPPLPDAQLEARQSTRPRPEAVEDSRFIG